ncbi:DUF2809 domain-containing protein [Pedobacter sp. KR3-3]|uniref:DUF2809 domain-containing protein n=1 Tax=Pedobacter albus TaxID=3113905 RepID=A0ABU7I973_9SPHI|nr:DUF2809 domain-containing protein [Pedobacter sp. KR3-3]MEE1946020.1 DUF2809 domain-containing protein [Pedobacter sp. KR3-3]
MFHFNLKYFLLAILIFLVEVFIALYIHDAIIRPYIGDVLVVILLYYAIRSFLRVPVLPTAIAVLIFAYLIEMLQYFQYVKWLGLQDSHLANVVMGNSFAWTDLMAYTIGIVLVLFFEKEPTFKRST